MAQPPKSDVFIGAALEALGSRSLLSHLSPRFLFEVLADVSLTRHQSARGRTAAVAHAMSIFVDGAAAAGGTIKELFFLFIVFDFGDF